MLNRHTNGVDVDRLLSRDLEHGLVEHPNQETGAPFAASGRILCGTGRSQIYTVNRATIPFRPMARRASSWLAALVWVAPAEV